MIRKFTSVSVVCLFLFSTSALPCAAQDFKGTMLSSENPFYGTPPYTFEKSQYYTIALKTSPEVIRELVPEPLDPGSDDIVQISFCKHHVVSPLKFDYYEVFFSIPVSFKGITGIYMPILYLDRVEGILPGREIWGYNKVGADIRFKEEEGVVKIEVIHLEKTIISTTINLGMVLPPPQRPEESNIFNLKVIPSVQKDAPPDVKQLTLGKVEGWKTHLFRPGKGSLEFAANDFNPLDQIPVMKVLFAAYTENSFMLDHGMVVHDYLSDAGKSGDISK